MARLTAGVLVSGLLGTVGYTVAKAPARTPVMPTVTTATVTISRTVTRTVQSSYGGRTARSWARGFHVRTRQLQSARRTLFHQPSVTEAIDLACAIFGSCSTLWRRARCESGLNPWARNPSGASGLFQFLPSTWATTPFGSFSIFSPFASALAGGWMEAHGRGGEWVCQ